jgi:8-oxo-dGTP diphosphatase
MSGVIPEFGTAVPGEDYILRPSAYSIITDAARVAIVFAPGGGYLPGGGQLDGESPEQAAMREALEECGLHIRLGRCIGLADELVYAGAEQAYFRKRCTFFVAELANRETAKPTEPDHQLVWMSPADAMVALRHESQRWALTVAHLAV